MIGAMGDQGLQEEGCDAAVEIEVGGIGVEEVRTSLGTLVCNSILRTESEKSKEVSH